MSCPECFAGSAWQAQPTGTFTTLHGVRTYVASGGSSRPGDTTIVMITDAFGFNLANSQLLADVYAASTGFRVLIPDVIPGGGVPLYSLDLMNSVRRPVAWWNVWGHLKRIGTIVRMMSVFIPFARRTRNVYPQILDYTRAVRADLNPGKKLGVAGFCWGAMHTIQLSAESASLEENGNHTQEPLVNAQFVAHPSGLKPAAMTELLSRLAMPFSIAIGDSDMILSKENVNELEAGLRMSYPIDEQPSRLEVKMYDKCGHGFAVRADRSKAVENEAADLAAKQAVNWFKSFLE
jgi:dienelactone hydrolase